MAVGIGVLNKGVAQKFPYPVPEEKRVRVVIWRASDDRKVPDSPYDTGVAPPRHDDIHPKSGEASPQSYRFLE